MRIRIIGGCGSGKSSAARKLVLHYGGEHVELDNLVWDRITAGKRNPVEVRDRLLREALAADSWVVEGVHYKWAEDTFREADYIFVLDPGIAIQDYRIVRRFIRSRCGLETWNYKQSFRNMIEMIKWSHGYNRQHMPGILQMTDPFGDKRFFVKGLEDILSLLKARTHSGGYEKHEPV